jgi:hypothetical protein
MSRLQEEQYPKKLNKKNDSQKMNKNDQKNKKIKFFFVLHIRPKTEDLFQIIADVDFLKLA